MLVEILGNVELPSSSSQDQNIRVTKEQPISNPFGNNQEVKFAPTTSYGFKWSTPQKKPVWNRKETQPKDFWDQKTVDRINKETQEMYTAFGLTGPVPKLTALPGKAIRSNPPNQPSVGFSGEGRKIGQFYQGMTFSKKHQRMVPVSPKSPISEKNLDTEGQ